MKLGKTNFLEEVASDWRVLSYSQKFLYFLYLFVLVKHTLPLFRAIENRIGLAFFTEFSDAFFIIVAVLGCITVFWKKLKLIDLCFILGVMLLHFISTEMNQETAAFAIENKANFFWACLPMFFVGLTIDSKSSMRLFVLLAYLAVILQIIYLSFFGMATDSQGREKTEMMGAAYNLLPFVCLLIWNAITRGGLIHWIMAIIASFLLFSLGARGPIICLIFFVAVYLMVYKHYKHGYFAKILIGIAAVLVYVFSVEIALFFSLISEQLGMSTRVFESVVQNQMVNIQESSNRDVIWEGALGVLTDNKIFWDFNLYADRLYNGLETQYVHNLELECLCDFGIIGGCVVLAILFLLILRAFKSVWDKETVVLMLVFFTASVMELQFSSSFLMLPMFWLFLGLCVSMIRDGNKNRLQRNRVLNVI
jgi:O-antigen ligase